MKAIQHADKEMSGTCSDELVNVEPFRATIRVLPDATPHFFKHQPVPIAIRDGNGRELDHLEQQQFVKKVTQSEWAPPIVVVCTQYRLDRGSKRAETSWQIECYYLHLSWTVKTVNQNYTVKHQGDTKAVRSPSIVLDSFLRRMGHSTSLKTLRWLWTRYSL